MDSDHGKRDDEIGTFKFALSNLKPGPNDLWFDFPEKEKKFPKLHVVITKLPTLEITVVKGVQLKSMDLNGKSDPYVIIEYANIKKRTKTISKNLNPEWNEKFEIDLANLDEPILFKFFDYDILTKDDEIGVVILTPTMLKNGKNQLELKLPEQGTLYLDVIASNLFLQTLQLKIEK